MEERTCINIWSRWIRIFSEITRNTVYNEGTRLLTGTRLACFTILELQNQLCDVSEMNKVRRSPERKSLKLRKGRSVDIVEQNKNSKFEQNVRKIYTY